MYHHIKHPTIVLSKLPTITTQYSRQYQMFHTSITTNNLPWMIEIAPQMSPTLIKPLISGGSFQSPCAGISALMLQGAIHSVPINQNQWLPPRKHYCWLCLVIFHYIRHRISSPSLSDFHPCKLPARFCLFYFLCRHTAPSETLSGFGPRGWPWQLYIQWTSFLFVSPCHKSREFCGCVFFDGIFGAPRQGRDRDSVPPSLQTSVVISSRHWFRRKRQRHNLLVNE